MVNKYHEYVLRAFLSAKLPNAVAERTPSVAVTCSVLKDVSASLMRSEHHYAVPDVSKLSQGDADKLIALLGIVSEAERDGIMDFYRLLMLTVSVLMQYRLG